MDKNELRALAQKYTEGTATPEEKQLLNQWYNTAQIDATETVELKNDETEADVKQRMLNNLTGKLFVKADAVPQIKKRGAVIKQVSVWIGAAAAVLMLGFFTWNMMSRNTVVPVVADKQVVNVALNKVMQLTLPDGSKVWLNAGSVFRYPKQFAGKTRQVELVEGRAFFDIKHQSAHPFIVKAKNINITVLGTSFDVRSYKKEGNTQVTVVTGKVGITMKGAKNNAPIFLLPSEQVVLSDASKQLYKEVAKEPAAANGWCDNTFIFDQESLGNVFKALEKQYNVKINVEDKKLLNEHVHITLNNQPLDSTMQTLAFSKHFKFKIANDSTITVR